MITINLLPQDVGRKAAKGPSGGPSQGALGVTAILILAYVVVIGVGAFFFIDAQKIATARKQVEAEQKALQKEVDDKAELYADLKEELEVLRNQVLILDVLDPEDRLYWAEKLNLLPQVVPDGVFLTQVIVSESVKQKETMASKKAYADWEKIPKKERPPRRPPKQYYPEVIYQVQFDGISYVEDGTDDERLEKVIEFHNQLKGKELTVPFSGDKANYMENMKQNIEIPFAEGTNMGEREVTRFTFYLKSVPFLPAGDKGNDNEKSKT